MVNIVKHIDEHHKVIASLEPMIPVIERVGREMVLCLKNGGKILFMGNGGSAADAQHLAAEFIGRFQCERKAHAAIALTTDTSILTAVGNDYGFEEIFSRQIEGLGCPGDIAVGISTSGNSPNVLKAIETANGMNILTVGFSGNKSGGSLQKCTNHCLTVESMVTARIQEAHIFIGHVLCDWVETELMAGI